MSWIMICPIEGVADGVAFSALIGELEAADPVASAVMSIERRRDGSVPPFLQPAILAVWGNKGPFFWLVVLRPASKSRNGS